MDVEEFRKAGTLNTLQRSDQSLTFECLCSSTPSTILRPIPCVSVQNPQRCNLDQTGYAAIDQICDYYNTLPERNVKAEVEPGYLVKQLPSRYIPSFPALLEHLPSALARTSPFGNGQRGDLDSGMA